MRACTCQVTCHGHAACVSVASSLSFGRSSAPSRALMPPQVHMSKSTEEGYVSLKRQFKGSLLRPDDTEYPDASRIWNGLLARRPGLIARCRDSSDVQAVVRAGRSSGVTTAV